jgi:prolyl-tRNA synthetase
MPATWPSRKPAIRSDRGHGPGATHSGGMAGSRPAARHPSHASKEHSCRRNRASPPQRRLQPLVYDVVQMAELADYAPVRGCMIILPYGYELWEHPRGLDRRFKEPGTAMPTSRCSSRELPEEGSRTRRGVLAGAGRRDHRRRQGVGKAVGGAPDLETIIAGPMPSGFSPTATSRADQPVGPTSSAGRCAPGSSCARWNSVQEGHTAHATYDERRKKPAGCWTSTAISPVTDAAIPVIPAARATARSSPGR